MSFSNTFAALSTVNDGRALLSSQFLEFCGKVRKNDPSILPAPGEPLRIRNSSEKEDIEFADALLENTSVTYLVLGMHTYTKSSAEAMEKYVRTSKRLQRISWNGREMRQREEIICCFLPAFQESTSLKELDMELPPFGGLSYLAFENMLTHTQSLRSLSLSFPGDCQLEDRVVAAASSGLKKNTTIQELTLDFSHGATTFSPILTSMHDHPLLRRLCLRGHAIDLTGLETLLLSDTSKITELEIDRCYDGGPRVIGLARVLQALARRPTLAKLRLVSCSLIPDEARLLQLALRNMPSLHTLVLKKLALGSTALGSTGLLEIAPALHRNTSISVLDLSNNWLDSMETTGILRDILRTNKTMTALDLSCNDFGQTAGAVECIADGLGSNSTLLNINLSNCGLRYAGISILAQTLGTRNTTLQKLNLVNNCITATGVGVLLETMEHNSHHITDLTLQRNPIGNEGASLLAMALENNALPNLIRLSLSDCGIGDDGFVALVSALEQNTSLLHLDLRYNHDVSELAFLALAESLPEIKVSQRIDLSWCPGLSSAMPLLLAGLNKNTSLFRFHVANSSILWVPPQSYEETARYAGGWMQEMERLGYRNRFLPLIRAPKESLLPRGIWPHALARAATFADVIFEVLRSKPNLVPSEETEGKESVEDPGILKKRKLGDK